MRLQNLTILFVASCFAFSPVAMAGSLFYSFEQLNSGTVLATLELASLPATHTEVRGLTFSEAGQAIFGLGPSYLGIFDENDFSAFIDDGAGGLRSGYPTVLSNLADYNPPTSSAYPDLSYPAFVLAAAPDPSPSAWLFDSILLYGTEFDSDTSEIIGITSLLALGYWRVVVPEPNGLGLAVSAILVGVAVGRRRKRAA